MPGARSPGPVGATGGHSTGLDITSLVPAVRELFSAGLALIHPESLSFWLQTLSKILFNIPHNPIPSD